MGSLNIAILEIQQRFLCKNVRGCWIFNVWIKHDQSLMKLAKRFVFLANVPGFSIKLNVDYILCILSIVLLIHINPCLLNCNSQRYFKKGGFLYSLIFFAHSHMILEYISLEEYLTLLALHVFYTLEHLLVHLQFFNLLLQDLIPLLHLCYCL